MVAAANAAFATYKDYELDAIRTYDSTGNAVTRYGWYPLLVPRPSRKRSASVALEDSQDDDDAGAGDEGRLHKRPHARKMSTSELVCFDLTSGSDAVGGGGSGG